MRIAVVESWSGYFVITAASASFNCRASRSVRAARNRRSHLADSFVAAAELTPGRAEAFMPLTVYSLVALVQEFLPPMLDQGEGAILTALGASAVRGLPHLSGPGPAQAAQRNYLQSLHAEVAARDVYVGTLCIGAIIEHSAFHGLAQEAKAAGAGRN